MCFDFLSQGHSEGLADLSLSPGRALLKSLGLLVRGLPGAQVPCPGTQQWDHKPDMHSRHYWLGFAIGAELREEVGWCLKLPGVLHAWGYLVLLWSRGEDVRWQHPPLPVRLCRIPSRCCSGLVTGDTCSIGFCFDLEGSWDKADVDRDDIAKHPAVGFYLGGENLIFIILYNGQNWQSFPLIWGLMPALIVRGSPLASLHCISSGTVNPVQCMCFTAITYLVKWVKSLLAISVQSESHNPGKPLRVPLMAQS